jgi:preprotein translocase subunit SecE
VAPTEDTPVKPLKVEGPGGTANDEARDGSEPDDADDARERSLQLGGGVPVGKVFGKYLSFLGEVREEMRKVTWPNRKTVIVETIVVIAITLFFTLLITGMDKVLATVFNWMLFGKSLPWQL